MVIIISIFQAVKTTVDDVQDQLNQLSWLGYCDILARMSTLEFILELKQNVIILYLLCSLGLSKAVIDNLGIDRIGI